MTTHPITTRSEWLAARRALLLDEKELTRQRDRISQRRRELPWVKVDKSYWFDGPAGRRSLAELFDGRTQLIVQHFMLGPDWEEGCVGCSFLADHADAANVHLQHHDVSLAVISRAPWSKIAPFKQRMGWRFPWLSSFGSDFNFDFHVSFTDEQRRNGTALDNYVHQDPGIDEIGGHSAFFRDEDGTVYHTYSTFGRGDELLIGTYNYLDIAPLGRNETGPNHDLTDWVRHHDRYQAAGHVDATGRYHPQS